MRWAKGGLVLSHLFNGFAIAEELPGSLILTRDASGC